MQNEESECISNSDGVVGIRAYVASSGAGVWQWEWSCNKEGWKRCKECGVPFCWTCKHKCK